MNAPNQNFALKLNTFNTNQFGETPLQFAPQMLLENGDRAVPQQFLEVNRTLVNLENVLARITTPDGFVLFALEDGDHLFLTVGVLGRENYPQKGSQSGRTKIVYGRRWLIDAAMPTSEVVQTAMLAVKKAREHELREKFRIMTPAGRTTTPFNCHQDLPLMAGNRGRLQNDNSIALNVDALRSLVSKARVAGAGFELVQHIEMGDRTILEVVVSATKKNSDFPELSNKPLLVVCETKTPSHVLHQLFNACLTASDRFVEETVDFSGFRRFSHDVCPLAVGEFSYQTRNTPISDVRFNQEFSDMSYRVDSAKAPLINRGRLGAKQREVLAVYKDLAGYLPIDSNQD